MSYTKGQWEAAGPCYGGEFPLQFNSVMTVDDSGNDVTICEIPEWVAEYAEEQAANAKLIAAAPDLLEALEVLLLAAEYQLYEDRKPAMQKAIEAISKAKS